MQWLGVGLTPSFSAHVVCYSLLLLSGGGEFFFYYAEPNSFIHTWNRSRSAFPTEGFTLRRASKKSDCEIGDDALSFTCCRRFCICKSTVTTTQVLPELLPSRSEPGPQMIRREPLPTVVLEIASRQSSAASTSWPLQKLGSSSSVCQAEKRDLNRCNTCSALTVSSYQRNVCATIALPRCNTPHKRS